MSLGKVSPIQGIVALSEHVERCPIEHARLTPPQVAFARDPRTVVLWRDGNQLGKSYALAYDAIHRARGTHPFQLTHRPPVRGLVIGISLKQMEPLMAKLWELVPKDEIEDTTYFTPGRGISGQPARLAFVRGPGKGSVISFATYAQGSKRIAGATLHFVTLDEPPPESLFGEVLPRVLRCRGVIRIGMTPTPDMPDQSWLQEKVEDGSVVEHNFGLKEENCWPAGALHPYLPQSQIDEYERQLLPVEKEMRMRGSWDPVVTGRWLAGWTTDNISDSRPPDDAYYGIGIDHGATAGKQAAMLVAFVDRKSDRPRVWFLDEYRPEVLTSPEQDAAGMIEMIERNGLEYDDVSLWIGDRVSRATTKDIEKSNRLLRSEIARALKRTQLRQVKRIFVPRKFSGSVLFGFRLMNTLFMRRGEDGRPLTLVHSRCVEFRKACEQFAGDRDDPMKDILDAGRYIAETALEPRRRVKFSVRC